MGRNDEEHLKLLTKELVIADVSDVADGGAEPGSSAENGVDPAEQRKEESEEIVRPIAEISTVWDLPSDESCPLDADVEYTDHAVVCVGGENKSLCWSSSVFVEVETQNNAEAEHSS